MSYCEIHKIDQLPVDYIFYVHAENKKQGIPTANIIHFDFANYDREKVLEAYRKRLSNAKIQKKKWKALSDATKDPGITYPTLKDTLNRFRKEKGIDTQKTLCIMANMDESRLSKEIRGTRPISRDTLFALSFAMNLSLSETEELFTVADKSLYSVYRLSTLDIERERFLMQFIGSSQFNVQEINDILMSRSMKLLGNFEDEVDDLSVAM